MGPGGTAPGTTRATRRRRRRTAARTSRTDFAHAREEKFLATEHGDFSRLLASTRSRTRTRSLADSLGWHRARLRGTRDVGDDDVRDDDAARGGGAGRRTGSEGAGLGLSLVDEHVKMHGGRVWVEDRLDGQPGARFVIELMASELDD